MCIRDSLQALGIKVEEGHKPENLGDADVVVKSSAVTDENPVSYTHLTLPTIYSV